MKTRSIRKCLMVKGVLIDLLKTGRQYKIHDGGAIGRADDCLVKLYSKQVSRYHAKIIRQGRKYYLEDMSANGTVVNGEIVSRARRELKDGDVVEIKGVTTDTLKFKLIFWATFRIETEQTIEQGVLTRLFKTPIQRLIKHPIRSP